MKIHEMFRIKPGAKVAVVGSGGKTSTIIRLAQSFGDNVIITTTTHLGVSQFDIWENHIIANSANDLDQLAAQASIGIVGITSDTPDGIRYHAPDQDILKKIVALSAERNLTVLVEADGSRSIPLKAPAAHEPAIPDWVDTVIVCAGCSGLGQKFSPEIVHRMDEFQAISGIKPGETVTPEVLARVLTHPQGGLKNIPDGAVRILVLNQADDATTQAAAGKVAEAALKGGYDRVLITSFGMNFPEPVIHARYEPVAGVLLAAGGSFRFGQPKQVIDIQGKPMIRYVAEQALLSGLDPLIVVVGAASDQVSAALDGLPIRIVHNPDWEAGQSTSVLAGLKSLPLKTGAVLYILGDQPYVNSDMMHALVERWRVTGAAIVAPLVAGQRANPVLFDRDTFPQFAGLSGDQGARALLQKFKVEYLEWHDERALFDIDAQEDYERYKRLWNED
jgi:molybdenum cofactor cytidylyltransferase